MYFVPPFSSPLSFSGLRVGMLDSKGWNVIGIKKHCSENPGGPVFNSHSCMRMDTAGMQKSVTSGGRGRPRN